MLYYIPLTLSLSLSLSLSPPSRVISLCGARDKVSMLTHIYPQGSQVLGRGGLNHSFGPV